MSKTKKKKTKNVQKTPPKQNKSSKKKIVAVTAAAAAVVVVIVVLVIFLPKNNTPSELTGKTWTSQKAYTASGDEAELAEVYSVNYTSYQGSLTFNSDNTFELWLTPGNPDDGTHKGTYELEKDKIKVKLDSGETGEFALEYSEDGKIKDIIVPYTNNYDSYEVYFY